MASIAPAIWSLWFVIYYNSSLISSSSSGEETLAPFSSSDVLYHCRCNFGHHLMGLVILLCPVNHSQAGAFCYHQFNVSTSGKELKYQTMDNPNTGWEVMPIPQCIYSALIVEWWDGGIWCKAHYGEAEEQLGLFFWVWYYILNHKAMPPQLLSWVKEYSWGITMKLWSNPYHHWLLIDPGHC